MNARKQELIKEYKVAIKMGCGDGFWSLHCQELIKYGITKNIS